MTALLDANVLVRHLTGDPPGQAAAATAFLAAADDLRLDRAGIAGLVEAIMAFPAIGVADHELLLRAVEVYERDRLDFAEAYLVAMAEVTGAAGIASFDRAIDRVVGARRLEPA